MINKSVKKLHIKTHGCQMNEYDSSRIQDLLGESHQMVATDDPEEADILLINTCSIREKAQEKLFHQLGRWKHLKIKNPRYHNRCGRMCCQPRRSFYCQAGAVCRSNLWPADTSPAPRDDCGAEDKKHCNGRYKFPRDRKV